MFLNSIFFRIFSILASENEAKTKVFLLLFRKRRFYENRAPVEAKLLFFRFRATQNDVQTLKNSMPKTCCFSTSFFSGFGLDFGGS